MGVEHPGPTRLFSHGGPGDLFRLWLGHPVLPALCCRSACLLLQVASPQHGQLALSLLLVSIPVSFCSWLGFLVAPWAWLTMPGVISGPQVQPCYAKSPSLAELCLLSFPKLLKKIPLCYLIPASSASCSVSRENGVSHSYIRERKKEDQGSHPAGLRALVMSQPGQGAEGKAAGSHVGLPTVT